MWQTRTLAMFIAATVPQDPDATDNDLMQAALDIGKPASATDTTTDTGEEKAGNQAAGERKPIEPKAGSYEAFMSTFARAMR